MATLFSYFKKTGSNPKKKKDCNGNETSPCDNTKDDVQPKSEVVQDKHMEKDTKFNFPAAEGNLNPNKTYTPGDLVWAKLGEYPWWPAMVCEHPSSKQFYMNNVDSKAEKIHVQFFEEPPSRDWVLENNVESFDNREPSSDEAVVYAFEMARRASKLEIKKRLDVYYACKLSDEEGDDDEEEIVEKRVKKRRQERRSNGKPKRKRLKILDSDDEGSAEDDSDGSTYEPEKSVSEEEYESDDSNADSGSAASDDEEETAGKRKRPVANKQQAKSPKQKVLSNITNTKSPVTPLSNKLKTSVSRAQASLAKFSPAGMTASPVADNVVNGQDFTHYGLKFLKDGHRKDKSMKLHTDPDYDPRTLHVPQSYIDSKEVTPGMKQWWTLKKDLYDTIIFFKVGKFYELYHMDAVVGVKELGLLFMKGNFAHCGFPEIGFSRYSEALIQKGYKVARVEQTETPQQLAARSGGKVVRREVCALISKGTRTFSFMEGESDESTSSYLLAFVERPSNVVCLGGSEFGVCFVDTSIGKFHLGQFSDDRQASRFLTMISQYPPAQVLYERNQVSPKVQHLLQHELLPTIKDALSPGSEFWTATKTLKYLQENDYFNDEEKSNSKECPAVLKQMLADGDSLSIEPSEKYQYAISALGACTWYLKKCCIHQELLSMSQFEIFVPSDNLVTEKRTNCNTLPQHMILDGVTLTNLDIMINNEGTTDGTLLQLLDNCTTPFGKRYFKQWLCMPSCNKHAIKTRLDAVEDLMKLSATVTSMQAKMKTIPDLERILRRIHSLGSLKRTNDHPDSRAIFYNEETYSKKKISDLLCAIEGFQKSITIINALQEHISSLCSPMLKNLLHKDTTKNEKGQFPDLTPTLDFFKSAFDHKKAKETGTIHPKPGVLAQYDESIEQLKFVEDELDNYLKAQRKRLGCSTIKYWGTGRNRHQLEIPESALMKSTPNDYHLASQKKGFKRFVSDTTNKLNERLSAAEELRDGALKDTLRSIFNKFDKHRELWEKAVRCLATLDCLMCLAQYSSNLDGVSCRPEIVDPVDADGNEIQPFFELLNCRHPCVTGGDFIPNDIVLGKSVTGDAGENGPFPSCVLITGPNMGGKSTLMRQAGVILIMAQLGCYVPADVCRFTPIDRIFTRLGARDRILHGESTFFVELSETSTIFQHATKHSLVLLDELGRGTATYDGTSIASAVVHDLATRIRCRTLFSTHYHTLVDDFSKVKDIKLGHMACMVEKDDEDNDDPSQETITFLYKFTSGACPKSYGFNAAKLAGLPMSVIKKGYKKAVEFEDASRNMRLCRKLLNSPVDHVKDIISLIG